MKCLIIAAGQGTRLRSIAPSKPLAPVRSVPLIEHVIRRAAAGGAGAFVVVTGYEAEGLEHFLAELAARTGLPIEAVRNPDWARPNGLSVLAAGARLESDFILLMSDHLFDPEILRALMAGRDPAAAVSLAVDRRLDNPLLDLDDATKVAAAPDGRIIRIGKALERYDAADTGIFIGTPALIEAIRASLEAGASGSLSEGVQLLADRGLAQAVDIGERWWIDVDDEAAMRRAEQSLPDELQPR